MSPLERLKILFQVQSAGREEYKLSVGKALGKDVEGGRLAWVHERQRHQLHPDCPYSAVQFGSYNFYKRVGPNLCPSSPRTSTMGEMLRLGDTNKVLRLEFLREIHG